MIKILNAVPDEGEILDFDFRELTYSREDRCFILQVGICLQRPPEQRERTKETSNSK